MRTAGIFLIKNTVEAKSGAGGGDDAVGAFL